MIKLSDIDVFQINISVWAKTVVIPSFTMLNIGKVRGWKWTKRKKEENVLNQDSNHIINPEILFCTLCWREFDNFPKCLLIQ